MCARTVCVCVRNERVTLYLPACMHLSIKHNTVAQKVLTSKSPRSQYCEFLLVATVYWFALLDNIHLLCKPQ